MLIERQLLIMSVVQDALDVQPSGEACFGLMEPDHKFREPQYAAGFKYLICGACGTVRISDAERFRVSSSDAVEGT
jgi:hypothetical protein